MDKATNKATRKWNIIATIIAAIDNKAKRLKPQSEWIKVEIPAFIEAATFEDARIRRAERAPE